MSRVTIAQIQQATAAHFGIALSRMLCRKRDRELSRPRQVAMWLAHETTEKSLNQIGSAFKRDHTTVLHGIRRIDDILQGHSYRRLEGEYIAKAIADITERLAP